MKIDRLTIVKFEEQDWTKATVTFNQFHIIY